MTRTVFFKDEDSDLSNYSLAASSGISFEIDKDNWELGKFLNEHSFRPSKLRLYLMHMQHDPQVNTEDSDDDFSDLPPNPRPVPKRRPVARPRLAEPLIPPRRAARPLTDTQPEMSKPSCCSKCKST